MEKNEDFATTSTQSSAPLPTAPPSYEEAIANTGGGTSTHPTVSPSPYPLGNAPISMPMPQNQPPNQARLAPSVYPSSSQLSAHELFNTIEWNSAYAELYAVGPNAMKMVCPSCHANIKTTTISDHRSSAHLCCVVLCLIGCCLCSCLPYCMNAFLIVHHFCPNCKSYIGTWRGKC